MSTPSTTTTPPIISRDVAKRLGISSPVLYALVRGGRTQEPQRDSSGRYIWSEADIEAARIALRTDRRTREYRRQREEVRHAQ